MNATSARHTALERREEIIEAAMTEFAIGGLNGTSTDAIARRVGVSQPYLFRLFGTKKEIFLAAVERGFELTLDAFRTGAESAKGDEVLPAMGRAYVELLGDRRLLLVQLHAYAACDDPEVRAIVRKGFQELVDYVARVSGAPEQEVHRFFSTGMMINVIAAMDVESVDEPWVRNILGPCRD